MFFKDLPILITGGAGFIGSHLAEELVKKGAKVTILDNLSTGKIDNLNTIQNKIDFINGSITDFNICKKATENKKIIFHLAALTSVPESVTNPTKCHEININGTFNILEAARQNNIEKFIFSSSSAVYGQTDEICDENMNCNPISPYGYSKLLGEYYTKQYSEIYNIKTVILRYFNVFGPRQDPNSSYAAAIAKFKYQLSNNLPIYIHGDGKQLRDFVPIERVIEANINLAEHAEKISGNIFNIATGKSISILELIEILKKDYPEYNQSLVFSPARPGDTYVSKASCKKYINFKFM